MVSAASPAAFKSALKQALRPTSGNIKAGLSDPHGPELAEFNSDFNNEYWTKAAPTSIVPNAEVVPGLGAIGDVVRPTTTLNSLKLVSRSFTVENGVTYRESIKLKHFAGFADPLFRFLSTERAVFSNSGTPSILGTYYKTVEMTPLGEGWWQCVATFVATSTTHTANIAPSAGSTIVGSTSTDMLAIADYSLRKVL